MKLGKTIIDFHFLKHINSLHNKKTSEKVGYFRLTTKNWNIKVRFLGYVIVESHVWVILCVIL